VIARRALPVLRLEVEAGAPDKPALGAPCNGCGVCCLAEPCPVGVLVTRRREGRCAALEWVAAEAQYRCGLLVAPETHVPRGARSLVRALAPRWIAAGRGCDSDAEIGDAELGEDSILSSRAQRR
jgi:hypothetical protein